MYANATRVRSSNPPIKLALLEKKSEIEISSYCWNILQFFGYLICILSGVATHLSFEDFKKSSDFCPLFANFSTLTFFKGEGVKFEQISTENVNFCSTCRYFSIFCSLAGGLLGLVYMRFLDKLRNSRKYTALLLVPNLIFFGLSISTAVLTISGFSSLCKNIQRFTHLAGNDLLEGLSCEAVMSLKWQNFDHFNLNENSIISQVSSVISVFGWAMGTVAFLSSRSLSPKNAKFLISDENKIEIGATSGGGGRTRGYSECSTEGLLTEEGQENKENSILNWCPCRMYP